MAKGKHAIALFEVITAERAAERHARPIVNKPRWWFNRAAQDPPDGPGARRSESAASTVDVADEVFAPSAEELAADPTLRGIRSPMRIIDTPVESAAQAEAPHAEVAPPEPAYADVSVPDDSPSSNGSPPADPTAPATGRRPAVQLKLDPDRHEVTVRMRYTTAIVAGFAVLVLVALGYVVGRQSGAPSQQALADGVASTEDIRRGPVHRGALDVGRNSDADAIARAERAAATLAQQSVSTRTTGGDTEARAASARESGASAPAQGGFVEQGGIGRRTIGLNYVVVQSYGDPDDAQKACDVLNGAGIQATIERGIPIAPTKYCVVGTIGFASPFRDSPQYTQYLRAITNAGNEMAPKAKIRKFEPAPFKWTQDAQGRG